MSIARKGIIVAGEYSGWEVVVAADRDGYTGGYYLYLNKKMLKGLTTGSSMRQSFRLS